MRKSVYGGQALIEGLMFKGPEKAAIVIRKPDRELEIKEVRFKANQMLKKIPFLRGAVEFFRMNVQGMKAIMYSAEFVEPDEAGSARQEKGGKLLLYGAVLFSILFSVALFIILPNAAVSFLALKNALLNNAIEGLLKLAVFTAYLGLTSRLPEMRRLWMYHGAEHKTIHCFENEEDLTVPNIRKYSTHHPRCGTSFLFSVIIVSIILFTVTGWYGTAVNISLRLLLLPVVAGVTYELFRLLWRSDNMLVRALNYPGMLFQHFTTREPDDGQIEVAIAAFNAASGGGEAEVW
jgi:uncharacterized protein YqhQ